MLRITEKEGAGSKSDQFLNKKREYAGSLSFFFLWWE